MWCNSVFVSHSYDTTMLFSFYNRRHFVSVQNAAISSISALQPAIRRDDEIPLYRLNRLFFRKPRESQNRVDAFPLKRRLFLKRYITSPLRANGQSVYKLAALFVKIFFRILSSHFRSGQSPDADPSKFFPA